MRERDQFAAAHTALAAYAAAGRFGWGHPLVATSLAIELRLSPTPVREALAHLAGEGVIERRPGRGYFARRPTASDIIDLYALHREYLRWSVSGPLQRPPTASEPSADPALRVEAVFDRLAEGGGNSAVLDAYRRISVRLRPIRRIEVLLNDTGLDTVLQIQAADHEGLPAELSDLLDEYHDGRFAVSSSLERVMRQDG